MDVKYLFASIPIQTEHMSIRPQISKAGKFSAVVCVRNDPADSANDRLFQLESAVQNQSIPLQDDWEAGDYRAMGTANQTFLAEHLVVNSTGDIPAEKQVCAFKRGRRLPA